MNHQPDNYREHYGCRRVDPAAVSREPITALGGEVSTDHCPGVLVDTPFVAWLVGRDEARQLGYSMGRLDDAPVLEVSSLLELTRVRRRLVALRQQEGQE